MGGPGHATESRLRGEQIVLVMAKEVNGALAGDSQGASGISRGF